MSTGQNKETFRRFNEGMNSGDWELISKTIDEPARSSARHSPSKRQERNSPGSSGRKGEYMGLPPTGKSSASRAAES